MSYVSSGTEVARATNGSAKGLTGCQKTAEGSENRVIELPQKMFQGKEMFEALGLAFEESDDLQSGKNFYKVTLPKGWTRKFEVKTCCHRKCFILDDKGRKRIFASYDCNERNVSARDKYLDASIPTTTGGYMELLPRFSIGSCYTDKTMVNGRVHLVDANNEVFYTAGDAEEYSLEYEKFKVEIERYLDKHFPDWRDPTKYWD